MRIAMPSRQLPLSPWLRPAPPCAQGLNFLAATLMLWMREEDAFWCLCAVIEDVLGCAYFDEKMVLPQARTRLGGVSAQPACRPMCGLALIWAGAGSERAQARIAGAAAQGHGRGNATVTRELPLCVFTARLTAAPFLATGPMQVDCLVFGHLLQGRFPTLWRHLQALEVDAASVTMHWCAGWHTANSTALLLRKSHLSAPFTNPPPVLSPCRFLCCFLNSLPLDSALRVWDVLFFAGSAVVLFRVALALIEIYEQVGRLGRLCLCHSEHPLLLLGQPSTFSRPGTAEPVGVSHWVQCPAPSR